MAANTFLPTGDRDPGDAFQAWRDFSQTVPEFSCSSVVAMGCVSELADDVLTGGGHFLQEDRGEQLVTIVHDFITATPDARQR